jgi:DNA polymerase-3 subunit epsilon
MRQCTPRLSARTTTPACALAGLGRCPAPCEHQISTAEYETQAAQPFRSATLDDVRPLVDRLLARIAGLSRVQRYEQAATVRTRLAALLRAAIRTQRLRSLTAIAHAIACCWRGWNKPPLAHTNIR